MEQTKKYFTNHNGQKSQLIYVILALFLGAFGIHNFYANRWGRGLIQLLLTIGTGLMGTVISSLWAVINIFNIDTDGDGHPFEPNLPAKYICGILGILKYFGEIVFWTFLAIGFFTGTLTHYGFNNFEYGKTIQKSYEKIVTPTETIVETSTTSTN